MSRNRTATSCAIVAHSQVPDLPAQALRLASVAFAGYAGVTLPTAGKINWYLERPRMRRDLSMGAVTGEGVLVSSVYITLERVQMAGALVPVALVDTVMTDPAYRRLGLARRTLTAALEASRAAGAVAALLFTVPASAPCHFYESLGFSIVEQIRVLARGQAPVASDEARLANSADTANLIAFWNHVYGGHSGYVPLDEPLWRWRRERRPPELPSQTWLCPREGPIAAAVNYCRARVIGSGAGALVLTDLAWLPGSTNAVQALALLRGAPHGEARLLAPVRDAGLQAVAVAAGCVEIGREAAMLAPLVPEGERLLGEELTPWYALPESVIGV